MATAKPASVKSIIKGADKDLVDTLCECGLNVLKGNVPLSPGQKKRLKAHKNTLRALSQKKQSLQKKKTLLQRGGFLGALLRPVLSVLGDLLFK